MPFKKLGGGRYQGPSGKTFNYPQVKLYYSLGGHFPGEKGSSTKTLKNFGKTGKK